MKSTFLSLYFHTIPLWFLSFISTTFSPYPEKRVSFLSLPLYQRQKIYMWQTKCTVCTLKADVTIKIIIKNVIWH